MSFFLLGLPVVYTPRKHYRGLIWFFSLDSIVERRKRRDRQIDNMLDGDGDCVLHYIHICILELVFLFVVQSSGGFFFENEKKIYV